MGNTQKGEEVIEKYRRLTLMVPRFWLSHFLLGRAYVEMGEPNRAIEAFSKSMNLNPLSPKLYDWRAQAYRNLNDLSLAVADNRTANGLSPDPERYARGGVDLFVLGQFEESIQEFDQAIDIYDLKIDYLVHYRKLDVAAKLNLDLALAHNNRGSVYHEAGDIEKAIDDYSEAVLINPNLGEAFFNRGMAFALMDKIAEAKQDFLHAENLGVRIPN